MWPRLNSGMLDHVAIKINEAEFPYRDLLELSQ
jgi:hypothetical protein